MPALTDAPLPSWRNLATAFFRPTLQDNDLAAPWCRSGDHAFWFSRSAWSLLAIAQWRQRLTGQTSISVWLPDFFCNASLVPLRSMGAQLLFYPLTEKLAPDLAACRALAHEQRPDLFVLVHFFGQPAPADAVAALCHDTGAWLIEDAAHVLRPIPGIGEQGDCVLYSPHKHLPIPDSAVLVVREHGPARLASQTSTLVALREVCRSLLNAPGFSLRPAGFWLVKRVLQRLGLHAWRRPVTPFLADAGSTSPELAHPKMSPLASRLLSGLLARFDTVAHLRQQHRLLWEQALTQTNPASMRMKPAPAGSTPYLAGFICDDVTHSEALYLRWQSTGFPVTTWPDLPPEVSSQPDHHRRALQLRQTRLYLPVHQTLEPRQISACGKRLLRKKID